MSNTAKEPDLTSASNPAQPKKETDPENEMLVDAVKALKITLKQENMDSPFLTRLLNAITRAIPGLRRNGLVDPQTAAAIKVIIRNAYARAKEKSENFDVPLTIVEEYRNVVRVAKRMPGMSPIWSDEWRAEIGEEIWAEE